MHAASGLRSTREIRHRRGAHAGASARDTSAPASFCIGVACQHRAPTCARGARGSRDGPGPRPRPAAGPPRPPRGRPRRWTAVSNGSVVRPQLQSDVDAAPRTFPTPSASSKLNTRSSAPSPRTNAARRAPQIQLRTKKSMSSEPPPMSRYRAAPEIREQGVQGTIVEAQVLLLLDDVAAQRQGTAPRTTCRAFFDQRPRTS